MIDDSIVSERIWRDPDDILLLVEFWLDIHSLMPTVRESGRVVVRLTVFAEDDDYVWEATVQRVDSTGLAAPVTISGRTVETVRDGLAPLYATALGGRAPAPDDGREWDVVVYFTATLHLPAEEYQQVSGKKSVTICKDGNLEMRMWRHDPLGDMPFLLVRDGGAPAEEVLFEFLKMLFWRKSVATAA
ncbi:MAG TPA: hypothetical protein VH482_13935 [Thermomicrobiales bacterium]|jgi:hypothetical protein